MPFTISETSSIEKMMATIEELKAQNERLALENCQLKEEKKNGISASTVNSLREALDVKEEKLQELKEEMETLRRFISSRIRFYVAKMEKEKERAELFEQQFILLENQVKSGVPDTIPTCQICVRPYSVTNREMTPRSLGCGHTLCEECAKSIVERAKTKDICCPFDRIRTEMDKGVTGLPKNFAIIQLIGNN